MVHGFELQVEIIRLILAQCGKEKAEEEDRCMEVDLAWQKGERIWGKIRQNFTEEDGVIRETRGVDGGVIVYTRNQGYGDKDKDSLNKKM